MVTDVARRIIPCLDVLDGVVVKGIQFRGHRVVGDVVGLAERYCEQGADELVLYDIAASAERRTIAPDWIKTVAQRINIPFAIAGGIGSLAEAARVLEAGAEKVSINSPALENPGLITGLAKEFGSQCVVIGVDSGERCGHYFAYQYAGVEKAMKCTGRHTLDWVKEAEARGAGEVVLNCMNQDGVRRGYDLEQLKRVRSSLSVPLVASGGAGSVDHFLDAFREARISAALAAGVFHSGDLTVRRIKEHLSLQGVHVRL